MYWKPPRGVLSYDYIRQFEQDLYGEWFTVDELPGGEPEIERLRPSRMARAQVVAEKSEALLTDHETR